MNDDNNLVDYTDPAVQQAAKEMEHMLNLQFHAAQIQAFEDIAALIQRVRQAQTMPDYRAIQRQLGKHLARVEKGVGEANERLSKVDHKVRRLKKRSTPIDQAEIDTLERERRQADFDRELYLRLARQYRCVGDAMAWQLYDFQTRYLNALGMNQGPGLIGNKSGAAAEEQEVERYWREEGAFALRHDYTNCLRIWDLSVFYPDHPERTAISEVKSGVKVKVHSRQRRLAVRVQEFVKRRVATSEDGTLLVHRSQESSGDQLAAQTNLPLMAQAIIQANEEGYGFASNSYLAITAVNLFDDAIQHPTTDMQRKLLQARNVPSELMEKPCTDYLFAFSHDKVGSPYGAPYSIYPFPPDVVAALTTGFVRLVVCLNVCAVIEACRKLGITAEFVRPSSSSSSKRDRGSQEYFSLRQGNAAMNVGALAIEHVLLEGLPIEDVIASIARELKIINARRPIIVPKIVGTAARKTRTLTTFIGLENAWRVSRNALHAPTDSPPDEE